LSGLKLPFCAHSNVYLTTAQSWPGFLKDLIFIGCAKLGGHRIILHRHGGNYQDFYYRQSPLRRALIRRTLALGNCFIVLGQALTEMYAFLPGYQDKVVVAYNGLPKDGPVGTASSRRKAAQATVSASSTSPI
jgi:hypothetical protein